MAIDSHMHCNYMVSSDQQKIIDKINNDYSLKSVINVGLNSYTSLETVEIANSNSKFYSSIGIHPLYVENEDYSGLQKLSDNKKVVAIGEIGLDNSEDNYAEQRRYLVIQILIANELRLPIIIHSNNANDEVIEIFERYAKPKYGCVFHCFQPDLEALNYIIENGFYISFAGKITYKTANKSLEILKKVPKDLFLVETDSPFITPEPIRDLENESSNISYIIHKIAEVREVSYKDIENTTIENTKRLFKKMSSN